MAVDEAVEAGDEVGGVGGEREEFGALQSGRRLHKKLGSLHPSCNLGPTYRLEYKKP